MRSLFIIDPPRTFVLSSAVSESLQTSGIINDENYALNTLEIITLMQYQNSSQDINEIESFLLNNTHTARPNSTVLPPIPHIKEQIDSLNTNSGTIQRMIDSIKALAAALASADPLEFLKAQQNNTSFTSTMNELLPHHQKRMFVSGVRISSEARSHEQVRATNLLTHSALPMSGAKMHDMFFRTIVSKIAPCMMRYILDFSHVFFPYLVLK